MTDHGSGLALLGAFHASGTGGHSVGTTIRHGSGTGSTGRFRAAGVGADAGPTPPSDTVFLFSPPTVRLVNQVGYALRTSFTRSLTVWKDENGVWQAASVPPYELLKAAQRLLSVGGRPEVVDEETADELIEAGVGTVTSIPREEAP